MTEKTSPFVKSIRPWIIRKAVSDYCRAFNMITNMDREKQANHLVLFENVKKLTDCLWDIKGGLYLIFKRVSNTSKEIFDDGTKFMPDQYEIEFMNNVGLLFHKTMIVRELEYVSEHYAENLEGHSETQISFDLYWKQMKVLFNEGIGLIKKMLENYRDNILIVTFLVENSRYVEDIFGEPVENILKSVYKDEKISDAYLDVANFCIESGWNDRAKRVLGDAIRNDPENSKIKELLTSLE